MKYFFLLLLIPGIVFGGHYGGSSVTNNYYTTPTVTEQSSGNSGDDDADRGAAIAMCLGGASFDYSNGWQGSGGGSWWKSEQAVCTSFATRVDDILLTGGVGCDTEFEDCGGTINANWHF